MSHSTNPTFILLNVVEAGTPVVVTPTYVKVEHILHFRQGTTAELTGLTGANAKVSASTLPSQFVEETPAQIAARIELV